MRKILVWTAGTFLVLCLAIYILTNGWVQPAQDKVSKLPYEASAPVTLDFEGAQIRVCSYDEAADAQGGIEVQAIEDSRGVKAQYKLDLSRNTARLTQYQLSPGSEPQSVSHYQISTWVPLVQFDRYRDQASGSGEADQYDFVIRVPGDAVLNIRAENISAQGCRIYSAEGTSVRLEDCSLLENFQGKGDLLKLESCTIGKGSNFQYKQIQQNDCTIAK